jgi:hypothetical protein
MTGNTKKIIEATAEFLKPFGIYLGRVWHLDDIHRLCQRHGLKRLTNKEVHEVFELASEHNSGRLGITKVQLEAALLTYLQSRVEA